MNEISLPESVTATRIYQPPEKRITDLKIDRTKLREIVDRVIELQKQIKERKKMQETAPTAVPTNTELTGTAVPVEPIVDMNGAEANAVITTPPEATEVIAPPAPPETPTEGGTPPQDATPPADAPKPAELGEFADVIKQLDSDNLAAYVDSGKLKRTASGLLDGVALFGSTHAKANWREESTGPALEKSGVFSYNPRMNEWNPELHPQAEALAMAEMSVLAMRIENKDILDGSLGSMVEMGMAALSAALNGQRLVVSIENNIKDTLADPGARAQYEAMINQLKAAEKISGGSIKLLYGDDMEAFNAAVVQAVKDQELQPASKKAKEAFEKHEKLKQERFVDEDAYDLFGGSSGSFAKEDQTVIQSFDAEQENLRRVWGNPIALNKEPAKGWWDYAQAAKPEDQGALYKLAFKSEEPLKNDARILIWSIQDEAVSKAAITEIGFMLLKALESGQQMMVVMEPFNAELYAKTVFREKVGELKSQITQQIESVKSQAAMIPYTEADITAANALVSDLENYDPANPPADLIKRIKSNPIVSRTRMFRDFDNARRTRAVIEAQMKKMVDTLDKRKDEIGAPFFTFASSVEEFRAQSHQIQLDRHVTIKA